MEPHSKPHSLESEPLGSVSGSRDSYVRPTPPNVQIIARFRQVVSHLVHFCGVMQLLVTLLLMLLIRAGYFFAILALDWGFNKFLCVRTAWREGKFKDRFQNWHCVCRLLTLAVVYGLAEWVQVEHIQACYNSRLRAGDQRAHELQQGFFHGKTLDSMTVSFPFALVTLFTFFLIGPNSPSHCPWYNYVKPQWLLPVQLLLICSFAQSCASIALGAFEVDYRVNEQFADEIERSPCKACVHLLRRGSEACFNITRLVLLLLFLPRLEVKVWGVRIGAFLLCVPVAVEWFLNTCILYLTTRGANSIRRLRNILCVAFAAITVNPLAFLRESTYKDEAQKASICFFIVRVCMITLVMCLMWQGRGRRFPADCEASGQTVWSNFYNHQTSLLCWSVGSFFVYVVLCGRDGWQHRSQGDRQGLLHRTTSRNRYYIPLLAKDDRTRAPNMSLEIKFAAVLTGDLSSFILALGGILASSMVPSRSDFEILQKLGEGTSGVAMKAKLRSTGDNYCLKLVLNDPKRELNILKLVTDVTHVFIVSLFRAFEVDPEGPVFKQNDGSPVRHERTGSAKFKYAMMITFVGGGDLDTYIKNKKWEMEHVSRAGKMRTFAAEIAEVLRFLHELGIVYRDLKPDNVLVKLPAGNRRQSHICLTDLGWAKRPTTQDPCISCAGNPATVAGEVLEGRIDALGVPLPPNSQKGLPYDESVDVFSWAANYLIIQGLPASKSVQLKSEYIKLEDLFKNECPTMPVKAWPLLTRCIGYNRPKMEDVLADEFFTQSFDHNGETYPSINLHELMEDAARDE